MGRKIQKCEKQEKEIEKNQIKIEKKEDKKSKGSLELKKLPRGFKKCIKCSQLLYIHQYKCTQCGEAQPIKTHKTELVKNLRKLDPKSFKSVRSLLELNAFNQSNSDIYLRVFPSSVYTISKESVLPQQRSFAVNEGNSQRLRYIRHSNPITCIASILDDIVYVESIEKEHDMREDEKITQKVFGLSNCHKVGCLYRGKSLLHYLSDGKHLYRVYIGHHIVGMKAMSNRLCLLTGQNTVVVVDMEMSVLRDIKEDVYELSATHCISLQDHATAFTCLTYCLLSESVGLAVGTLQGHIFIYALSAPSHHIVRVMRHSHFEHVTALAQCPSSNARCTLLASAGYDGQVCIWTIAEHHCLFRTTISSKNILQLLWDPGAKTLLILKDECTENVVFMLFYNLIRTPSSLAFSPQMEIKTHKTPSNCQDVSQDPRSNEFVLLDSRNNLLMMYTFEELRKCGQNRKPLKTGLFKHHCVSIENKDNHISVHKKQICQKTEKKEDASERYHPRSINAICHVFANNKNMVYGSLNSGTLFWYVMSECAKKR